MPKRLPKPKPVYRRILLKISGEALAGKARFGIDENIVKDIATQVAEIHHMGVQVALVIGGGEPIEVPEGGHVTHDVRLVPDTPPEAGTK